MDPAIEGNYGLLKAVAKHPAIKRVVITSSCVALFNASDGTLTQIIKDIYKNQRNGNEIKINYL